MRKEANMKGFLRIAVAAWMALAPAATLGQAPAQKVATAVPARQESGGLQESFRVRGEWVIEVREPGGKLLRREQFKNAITPQGKALLLTIATGGSRGYSLDATFDSGTGGQALCGSSGGCTVFEGAFPIGHTADHVNVFPSMTITLDANSALVFNGSFTVTAAGGGTIARVTTSHVRLTGPGGTSAAFTPFTEAVLPTPIQVGQGRIVSFTYTLSFS